MALLFFKRFFFQDFLPDLSLCYLLEYSMSLKLLTKHYLEFLCLKGGYTGSSESTLIHVKMSHCSKSHVAAQFFFIPCSAAWAGKR